MKKGKKYVEVSKLVDRTKLYTKDEAVKLVKDTNPAKFDASVELVLRLNLDTRKADQQLRGATVLPNGTGKTKKVLVLAKGAAAQAAKEAGADYVGDMDLITKIDKENWFDFDIMIATPDMMPALGKLGKVLGPKGLMPNPKTGTVTLDTAKAVNDVKKGRVEYRTDSFGNVAVIIGKVSFTEQQLKENLEYFVSLILKSKPTAAKEIMLKTFQSLQQWVLVLKLIQKALTNNN
jgi:large subunit ribosomal protein L1